MFVKRHRQIYRSVDLDLGLELLPFKVKSVMWQLRDRCRTLWSLHRTVLSDAQTDRPIIDAQKQ